MIDQQQQRDTADERATRAELEAEGLAELEEEQQTAAAVAATIGTFAMHELPYVDPAELPEPFAPSPGGWLLHAPGAWCDNECGGNGPCGEC